MVGKSRSWSGSAGRSSWPSAGRAVLRLRDDEVGNVDANMTSSYAAPELTGCPHEVGSGQRRALFLVDRRALAAQAVRAFSSFQAALTSTFNGLFERSAHRATASRVPLTPRTARWRR